VLGRRKVGWQSCQCFLEKQRKRRSEKMEGVGWPSLREKKGRKKQTRLDTWENVEGPKVQKTFAQKTGPEKHTKDKRKMQTDNWGVRPRQNKKTRSASGPNRTSTATKNGGREGNQNSQRPEGESKIQAKRSHRVSRVHIQKESGKQFQNTPGEKKMGGGDRTGLRRGISQRKMIDKVSRRDHKPKKGEGKKHQHHRVQIGKTKKTTKRRKKKSPSV